ncbi:MAG: hypothetical protein ABR600_03025 [Actinomycetota bacterium]
MAKLNTLCRQEAAATTGHIPQPSAKAANDLQAGRMTIEAARFLGQFADVFLTAADRILAKARSWQVSASDRPFLDQLVGIVQREKPALRAVIESARTGDTDSVTQNWERVQRLSEENSALNERWNLTACGTLRSPAAQRSVAAT